MVRANRLKKVVFLFSLSFFNLKQGSLPRTSNEFKHENGHENLDDQKGNQICDLFSIQHAGYKGDHEDLENQNCGIGTQNQCFAVIFFRLEINRVHEKEIVLVKKVL